MRRLPDVGMENNCPFATVETVSRHRPPTGFLTPHRIPEPRIPSRTAFLSNSGIIIGSKISVGSVQPNVAGFDQARNCGRFPGQIQKHHEEESEWVRTKKYTPYERIEDETK